MRSGPIPERRLKLYGFHNPIRGMMNAVAALVAILGVWALAARAATHGGEAGRQFVCLVFSLSLVGLYTISSVYHSVPWSRAWKKRMKRIDHAMIYVVIAATYTPLAGIVLDGWLRFWTLTAVWLIAAVGIGQKLFARGMYPRLSIVLQTGLGWLGLLIAPALASRLPVPALILLGVGGVLYTIGMVFFVLRRPRLWPTVFSYHEAFHILVFVAGATHFFAIWGYVAAYR